MRVYDDSMRFVGRIQIKDNDVVIKPFPTGEPVQVVQNGVVVEAVGYFRLEQMTVGWTVFDGKSRLVGYIAREGERWNFREQWGGEPTVFAETGSEGTKILKGTTVVATSDRMSPALGLLGSLTALTPLARAGLGLWLQKFGDQVVPLSAPPLNAADVGNDSEIAEELPAPTSIEGSE